MTKVNVSEYNDRIYFEASGHATLDGDSGTVGAIESQNQSERVCAAISILMLAAAHRFKQMESDGDFYSSSITLENGYALFDIEPREDIRERVAEIIEMLCSGISLLEEHYPELITLT